MNIFKFINSVAVADHLKSIDYKFSTIEKAFLVFQAENVTLKEKHEAYRDIIATESDTKIEKRPNTEEYPSLFAFLHRYMEIENELIEEFYNTKSAIFRFRYLCGNDESYCEDYETVYPSLEQCESAYKEEIEDYSFDIKLRYYEFRMDSLEEIGKHIEIKFSPSGEILTVDSNMLGEEKSDILSAMDGMWFAFPTPFKRGDIIVEKHHYRMYKGGDPVVVTSLGTWNKNDYIENGYTERETELKRCEYLYNYYKKNGDTSDMTYRGYFGCDDGNYYHEVGHEILCCEYYTEKLTGGYRTLKVVSDFEKGELTHDSLVKVVSHIVNDEKLKDEVKYIHLQDEYLETLGVI